MGSTGVNSGKVDAVVLKAKRDRKEVLPMTQKSLVCTYLNHRPRWYQSSILGSIWAPRIQTKSSVQNRYLSSSLELEKKRVALGAERESPTL